MADNRNEQNGKNEYYDYFPYKSYEELNAEKRRNAVRRGLGAMGALFLLLVAVVVGIGLLVGGSPLNLWSTLQGGEAPNSTDAAALSGLAVQTDPGTAKQTQPPTGGTSADLDLDAVDVDRDAAVAVYVKDVTQVVEKARLSVVGVTTESYSDFSCASSGSGIILSEDGYIVTNNHVVSEGESISVTLDDGTVCPAYVIGRDEYTDIAVLKISADGLVAAELGDSDKVEVGQAAIAIGNPTGQLLGTATAGIVSGVNRDVLVNNTVMSLLQTDAAINAGNSGGPLLNQYGQVVGVTSVKVSMTGYEGLGFAIPINSVIPIVEELVRNGYVGGRPLVGVAGSDLSYMAARFYGLPQGIYVNTVDEEYDAYTQGLRPGDIITAVGETPVTTVSEACAARNDYDAGAPMTMTVYRKGQYYQVTVTLGEQTDKSGNYNF